jgi:Ca2+-binding RTX toxin-like protein
MASITGNGSANTLTGTSRNDILRGLGGNDTLSGLGGNDRLDGGTGNDLMRGAAGHDTYVVDSTRDVAIESANAGIDRILSSVTRTLGANIENLTLVGGTAIGGTGNSLRNLIIGNSAPNTLRGLDGFDDLRGGGGNDRLEGGRGGDRIDGGLGNDLMIGATGEDSYVVNSAGDVVLEASGGGNDLVSSSISYRLGSNLERLALTGRAVSATGNDFDNVILGNSADNILRGNAGNDVLDGRLGNDAMFGGVGNDTYAINSAGDSVVEAAGGGTDLILSSLSFDLGTVSHIEKLTLLGAANLNGTGTAGFEVINGNSGNNTLSGLGGPDTLVGNGGSDRLFGGGDDDWLDGGTGADTMTGGTGNDTYFIDNAGDVVVEDPGSGRDGIRSLITFDLRTTPEVEGLLLLGTANINGTGSAGHEDFVGNSGANVIDGGGGQDLISGGPGNDILIGGTDVDFFAQTDAGADVYRYDSAAEGGDVSHAFKQAEGDRIRLLFDADPATLNIKEQFTFIGTDAFNGQPGQIRYELTANGTSVLVNLNGTAAPEFSLFFSGQINFTSGDFGL